MENFHSRIESSSPLSSHSQTEQPQQQLKRRHQAWVASYFTRHNMRNDRVHFRKNKFFIHSLRSLLPTTSWSTNATRSSLFRLLLISRRSHTRLNVNVDCVQRGKFLCCLESVIFTSGASACPRTI